MNKRRLIIAAVSLLIIFAVFIWIGYDTKRREHHKPVEAPGPYIQANPSPSVQSRPSPVRPTQRTISQRTTGLAESIPSPAIKTLRYANVYFPGETAPNGQVVEAGMKLIFSTIGQPNSYSPCVKAAMCEQCLPSQQKFPTYIPDLTCRWDMEYYGAR